MTAIAINPLLDYISHNAAPKAITPELRRLRHFAANLPHDPAEWTWACNWLGVTKTDKHIMIVPGIGPRSEYVVHGAMAWALRHIPETAGAAATEKAPALKAVLNRTPAACKTQVWGKAKNPAWAAKIKSWAEVQAQVANDPDMIVALQQYVAAGCPVNR